MTKKMYKNSKELSNMSNIELRQEHFRTCTVLNGLNIKRGLIQEYAKYEKRIATIDKKLATLKKGMERCTTIANKAEKQAATHKAGTSAYTLAELRQKSQENMKEAKKIEFRTLLTEKRKLVRVCKSMKYNHGLTGVMELNDYRRSIERILGYTPEHVWQTRECSAKPASNLKDATTLDYIAYKRGQI